MALANTLAVMGSTTWRAGSAGIARTNPGVGVGGGPWEADMLKGVNISYRRAALRPIPSRITQDAKTEDRQFHRGPLTRRPYHPHLPAYDAVRVASKAELADRAVKQGHTACLLEGQQGFSREHAFVIISE
jgi:hypothetical protein